jgi:class 3 adenylate cyclase/predicted ATPase/ActR/RegA family two-component response regulator
MDHTLSAYIPIDRRLAMARGVMLPDRAGGAALFADISGFTPLSDVLTRELGARRGVEELIHHINQVYDTLIAEVDRFGGSVISFAGDSIICWFHNHDERRTMSDEEQSSSTSSSFIVHRSSFRAAACALALQEAMRSYTAITLPDASTTALALKVAVASGPARRFVVGDPGIQLIDVLSGETITRMATAEHLATKGEVLIDTPTAFQLGDLARIAQWRTDPGTSERFAVLRELRIENVELRKAAASVDASQFSILNSELVRPWLLPAVYERQRAGLGAFLTELRPTVALFLRFVGIDFESDAAAGTRLDTFIRRVQGVLSRYEGTLLQLTIGDKGSYLYATFGAPAAHEDDVDRAVCAAMELRALAAALGFLQPVQIGISQGTMRTGAYGGATRRTYGVLGDDVNLAARLMQHAAPGEILANGRVREATAGAFTWESLPAIQVKGKSEPVVVARLVGKARVERAAYAGALVGRAAELTRLQASLQPIFAGSFAGIIAVHGEPGIGKSRLVHELRQRLTLERPLSWYTCPAEGMLRQSLHPFRHFLREYFEQDQGSADTENKARFDAVFNRLIAFLATTTDERDVSPSSSVLRPSSSALAAELQRSRAFLAALVDLPWDDLTYGQLEPKLRFENTLHAFTALVKAQSLRQPLVAHIEDAHWLDVDSQELVRVLARNAGAYPVAILLSGRYRDDRSSVVVSVDADVPLQAIDLDRLASADIRALAAQMLDGDISDELATFLAEKTNGNPFFVEQLALDLRERGLLHRPPTPSTPLRAGTDHPFDTAVPELVEGQGRRPPTTEDRRLKIEDSNGSADEMRSSIFYPLSSHNPSIVSRQSSAWEMRTTEAVEVPASIAAVLVARLDRLAAQVKAVVQTAAVLGQEFEVRVLARMLQDDQHVHTMVGHAEAGAIWFETNGLRYVFRHALLRDAAYEMQVRARLRELHALAGTAIEQVHADELASHYADLAYHYGKAEDLDRERRYSRLAGEQAAARFANGEAIAYLSRALELMPEDDAVARYEILLAREQVWATQGTRGAQSHDLEALAALAERLGDDRRRAVAALRRASYAEVIGDDQEVAIAARQVIALAHAAADPEREAIGYMQWGRMLMRQADYSAARAQIEQALTLARAADLVAVEADSLRNLGLLAAEQADYRHARAYLERSLRLSRALGDRQGESSVLANVGLVAAAQGDTAAAQDYHERSLRLCRTTGNRYGESIALLDLGLVAAERGEQDRAGDYLKQSLHLCREIGDRWGESIALLNLGLVAAGQDDYNRARDYLKQSLHLCRETGDRRGEARALSNLGVVAHRQGDTAAAQRYFDESLRLGHETGEQGGLQEWFGLRSRAAGAVDDMTAAQLHVEQAPRLARTTNERPGMRSAPHNRDRISGASADDAEASSATNKGASMGSTILIVDDEPHIRLLIAQTLEELEDRDVTLLSATNGDDALELVKTTRPALIFLDVMIPRRNGFDLCQIVKHELGMHDTYIVLLTAKGQEFDRQLGQTAGADTYMTKPFDPDQLLQTALDVLGLS